MLCGQAMPLGRSAAGRHRRALAALVLLLGVLSPAAAVAEAHGADAALEQWLARQARIAGWQARVEQVREMPGLDQPTRTRGRVWFQRPNRFRWQLGDPPRSIAVRDGGDLVIHYPRLERTERYAIDAATEGPERQALALLEVGFPEDPAAFLARYEVVDVVRDEGTVRFRLRPADAQARRLLEGLTLVVEPDHPVPRATVLRFADGSVMRNRFTDRQAGAIADDDLFRID